MQRERRDDVNWTIKQPATPGLYWYRHHQECPTAEYEILKVTWDSRRDTWILHAYDCSTVPADSHAGEWYGPIAPPSWQTTPSRNTRIAVRLRHGGSFYIDKAIPEDVAVHLSEKLRDLREKGEFIPGSLRGKITGVVRALIAFAEDQPDGHGSVRLNR